MKKQTSLCMGCMAEFKNNGESADICEACGYSKSSVFLSSYLAPSTFLAERYIIGKLISYNGEGALYIAFDTVSNVKVTIREYMPDNLCGRKKEEETIEVNSQYVALYKTYLSEFVELNKSLMNAGQSLRIQKVLNVFSENNTAYAVYEYITGISLKTYLSNLGGVLPWEQVKELFTPVFTTLNLIHTAGIVHRGISPSTILLNDKSELVLINFGITASRTYGSEINFEVFGGYAAPEQYSSAQRHGSHTDVYGLSAVLYKVLTGQMPSEAVARQEFDNLTEPMLINRNIPPSVSAAIMKGLTLNIDERTPAVGDFINGLFEASPVTVPDTTNEILIKKPLRAVEAEEARPTSGGSRRVQEKRGSNAATIAVLIMLGLVFAAFITIIIKPDLIDHWVNSSEVDSGTQSSLPPVPTDTTPQNPVNSDSLPVNTTEPPPRSDTGSLTSEPLYLIPDFTSPPRNYERTLSNNAYKFLKFEPVYEYHDVVDEGFIFEQSVPPGELVADGKEVIVKVSKGPENAELPDFKGKTSAEYENMLFFMKIKYESKGQYSDTVPEGQVINCSVPAGTVINIAAGDTVTIFYSLGPDPSAGPDVPEDDYDSFTD